MKICFETWATRRTIENRLTHQTVKYCLSSEQDGNITRQAKMWVLEGFTKSNRIFEFILLLSGMKRFSLICHLKSIDPCLANLT